MSIIPKLFHSWLLKCVIMCWIFLFHTCNESDTIAKAVAPAVMILIFQRKKNRTNCKCSIMSQGNSKMQFHFYAILLKLIRNCYANANAHIHTLAQSVSFSQREKLHQNLFSVLGACVFLFVEICSFIYVNIHFFVVIDCCDSHQIQWMHT